MSDRKWNDAVTACQWNRLIFLSVPRDSKMAEKRVGARVEREINEVTSQAWKLDTYGPISISAPDMLAIPWRRSRCVGRLYARQMSCELITMPRNVSVARGQICRSIDGIESAK